MDVTRNILNDLRRFMAYPTISSEVVRQQSMYECAAWLVDHLYAIGLQKAELCQTSAHPLVYAEYQVHPSLPTLLFYGHYDVQPVDPLNKWDTPPFKAAIKGDYIVGRGASDDKGQLFIHIKAVEDLLQGRQSDQVNIKFLIEGSEEIGSIGLRDFITSQKERLKCDVAIVSDTKMSSLHVPAITYSLRGSLNAELIIQTMGKDLHSGTFGGGVPNAATLLSTFIGQLHNRDHAIAIPGFYDDVRMLSSEERLFIADNGISDDSLLRDADAFSSWGEPGYTLHERMTIRPSLAVTGITAGFQGKGVKNVIPSVASAKLNFRLVPDQDPKKICSLLDHYIEGQLPLAKVKTRYSSFNHPVTVPRSNPYIVAATRACEYIFGRKVKFLQNGGTIGAVDYLHSLLGIPIVLMGFGQGSDNIHAPNERMYLPNFFKGIDTVKIFIELVASMNRKK